MEDSKRCRLSSMSSSMPLFEEGVLGTGKVSPEKSALNWCPPPSANPTVSWTLERASAVVTQVGARLAWRVWSKMATSGYFPAISSEKTMALAP